MAFRISILFSLLAAFPLLAQELNLEDYNERRLQLTRQGMVVLGSWAVGNIALGSVQSFRTEGVTRSFHQMNAGWNAVNLVIAGVGYYSAFRGETTLDLAQTLAEQKKMENILLFNAGLDVGYMAFGLYLNERGKHDPERGDMLRGFGQSLILQGAFLFTFDIIMARVLQGHFKTNLSPALSSLPTAEGFAPAVGFVWQF